MSDDSQPGLSDLRAEVLRLLGHCFIRLQRYEMYLKALLQARDIRVEQHAGSEAQLTHGIETEKNTLGALVAKFLDCYLLTEPPESDEDTGNDLQTSVRVRRQIITSAQDHQEVRDELRSFVALRNHLVHHFIEGKDLTNSDDCRRARQELTDALKRIEHQLSKLVELLKNHDEWTKVVLEHGSRNWVMVGMPATPEHWEVTDIVADLRVQRRNSA